MLSGQGALPLIDAVTGADPAYRADMNGPTAVFVSFRLGGTDGVSVEARKWETALGSLGFATRRVAGEILDERRDDDTVVPELSIPADTEPPPDAVEASLAEADLVVVENVLSLPLNLPAARVVAKVVSKMPRVVLRHHDLPWQRDEHGHVTELPPPLPDGLHITINDRSRRDLASRGIHATTIRNHFDLDPPRGDRARARARLGVGDGDVVVLHPVRAIARKNVPRALAFVADLQTRLAGRRIHYWLPGPAEDGYGPTLSALLRSTAVSVLRTADLDMPDAYAACDLVIFPSTWEGFGNPVVESVAHRRPLAVSQYPVLGELTALGFEFLDVENPGAVAAVLAGTRDDRALLDRNLTVARRHLALEHLPGRLRQLFGRTGWSVP